MRSDTEQFLMHYGKKGMRWGVRNAVDKVETAIANRYDRSSEANARVAAAKQHYSDLGKTKFGVAGKVYSKLMDVDVKTYNSNAQTQKRIADAIRNHQAVRNGKIVVKYKNKAKVAADKAKNNDEKARNNLLEANKLRNRKLTTEDRKEINKRQVLRDHAHSNAKSLEAAAGVQEALGHPESASSLRSQAYQYRLEADTHNDAIRRIATNADAKAKADHLEWKSSRLSKKSTRSSERAKRFRELSKDYSNRKIR